MAKLTNAEIIASIEEMSVLELNELVKAIEEKFGVTAAAPVAAAAPAEEEAAAPSGDNVINLWAFTDEVPGMVDKFLEAHPDFPYTVESTIIATTDGAYQPALDQALASGGADAPDMYCAEAAFILKYAQGDASHYAASYKDLGIVSAVTRISDKFNRLKTLCRQPDIPQGDESIADTLLDMANYCIMTYMEFENEKQV